MSEDASATYRGFRNQALYVLNRVLTDEKSGHRIYRPEGGEDLAVFDSKNRLIEAIQVKDHKGDLALSHFKPSSKSGFFARYRSRRIDHPQSKTKLASFGEFGPELQGAISAVAAHRTRVISKLCEANHEISEAEAREMLTALADNVVQLVEVDLKNSVRKALLGTNVAGDLDSTLDLLMYWIFDASENQKDLTRRSLLMKLEQIGRFLADLRDCSAEWEASLEPVRALQLDSDRIRTLTNQYRQGVQARWEHIVAGADHPRSDRLEQIHKQLKRHSVVIVRGVSGQGKSSLCWRYLQDFCSEGLRFHVKLVEGREHALRVANALSAHTRRLNLDAVVFLDVSPFDRGWSALVGELAIAGLKVLVAIREEDFQRANIAVGDFDYSEVVLDHLTKMEAEVVFEGLREGNSTHALDFEDAWAKFGAGDGGPLMEFAHLVTQGQTLASRIESQVVRLQKNAAQKEEGLTEAHLELLALAAIANSAGSGVYRDLLFEATGVHPLTAPLKILQNEYFLRITDDNGKPKVTGLHALRSQAIVKALFADSTEQWVHYATRVLPLIVDEDLEGFLLYAFSRNKECSEAMIESTFNVLPRSWSHAACIGRALIWEGLSRHEIKNSTLLASLIEKANDSWWILCDSLVGMESDPLIEMRNTLATISGREVEPVPLTPKLKIFDLFASWACTCGVPPSPRNSRDWAGVGDVSHWIGQKAIEGRLKEAALGLLPIPLPENVGMDDLSQFISGRAQLNDAEFLLWHDSVADSISRKFLNETRSTFLSDDGNEVKVFFLIGASNSDGEISDTGDWHQQTMKRVGLLRRLFPNRTIFSAQVLGLTAIVGMMPYDPTFKSIPVESLHLERNFRINSIFRSLVEYRHLRLNNWKEYAKAAHIFRKSSSSWLRKLHKYWDKLLSESFPRSKTISQIPLREVIESNNMRGLALFPCSSVDEWGFITELTDDTKLRVKTMRERSLERYRDWKSGFKSYRTSVSNIGNQIVDLTESYLKENKGALPNESDERISRLMLVNVGSAWEELQPMQRAFRELFGGLFGGVDLDELDRNEEKTLEHLWAVSFALRYHRHRHISMPGQAIEANIPKLRRQFLDALRTKTSVAFADFGTVKVNDSPWMLEGQSHLLVVCDHNQAYTVSTTSDLIVEAIWSAARSTGLRTFESKPLEIKWPKIAVVHLVKGRALVPACARLSTLEMFSSEELEIQAHHLMPLPVPTEEFLKGGFQVATDPLVRAVIELQVNIANFILTISRFGELADLCNERKIEKEQQNRIFDDFHTEFEAVRLDGIRSSRVLMEIMDVLGRQYKEQWNTNIQKLCSSILFNLDEESTVSLDLNLFMHWETESSLWYDESAKIFQEIIEYALADL